MLLIASWCVAAIVAAYTCPGAGPSSFGWLVFRGLLSLGASAGVAAGIARNARLEAAGVAAWFPVAFFFLYRESLWMLAGAVMVAASAARLLRDRRPAEEDWEPVPDLFSYCEGWQWTPRLYASFFAAICVLASVLLASTHPGRSALVLAAGTAAAAWHWVPFQRYGRLWRIPVAASVLLVAMMPAMRGGGGTGDAAATPMVLPDLPSPNGSPGPGEDASDVHSGIILWPEEEPVTKLVAPLPKLRPNLFASSDRDPLSIPFYGVYWLLRPPHKKPPPNAYSMRGDPARSSFRSIGGLPLTMEARQNFGRLFDSECCRMLKLVIRNGNRYPVTTGVELFLVNTTSKSKPQSLGTVTVEATVRWLVTDTRPPVEEVLEYQMPPQATAFDEVIVRYHQGRAWARRSAKIAIDRFVFVPRGG